ncbi:MAG: hypothetical protein R3E01_25960 [Pirellulaceae bacterium]|nr:hypothetical protein [Planctomycetales bacterium]
MQTLDDIHRLTTCRRILVLGSSGSGKTTFALRLSGILQLPTIHLDAHFWKPGWVSTPQEQWRETVQQLVQRESWIIDGMYESTLDLRVPAADALIVLEHPRLTCLWRALKRRITVDDERRPDAPPGQLLDIPFLRYIWRYPYTTRPLLFQCIAKHAQDKLQIVLRGQHDVHQFFEGLNAAPCCRGKQDADCLKT